MADITLDRPAPGQQYEISNLAEDRIVLNFATDEPLLEKVDDALVFTFEDGGSIILENFYTEYSSENMPDFVIEGMEISGEQFFAALGEDLMPAAGPAAGGDAAARNARYNQYGNADLMDGINRLDGLDIGFGRDGQVDDHLWGAGGDTGTGWFPPEISNISISIDNMYEDGQPMQHVYGNDPNQPQQYGKLSFSCQTGNHWTIIDIIELTGLHEGTVIYFGDPNDPNTEFMVMDADGILSLTPEQIANGVYFKPPANSDLDMDITTRVQITSNEVSGGGTVWVEGPSFTIIVDAVADLPFDLENQLVDDGSSQHHMSQTEQQTERIEDGLETKTYTVTNEESQGVVNVTVQVTASFSDYEDGSELHFILVEVLPGFSADYEIIEIDGVNYFKIPVDNADIADGNGTITIDVTMQAPQTDTDQDYSIRTGAMAEEQATDGELTLDNNTAVIIDGNTVDFTVDVINSGLEVNAGWASEGNNDAKHLGKDSSGYEYEGAEAGATISDGQGNNGGAPFSLGLSGGEGSTEYITEVTFTYDESMGTLIYNGQEIESGKPYDFSNDPQPLNFEFVPADGHDSNDVTIGYEVNVSNDTGASATFNGESTIVIDAVADQGIMGDHDVSYDADGNFSAAVPGAVVEVSGSIQFHDTDGSELHYAVIAIPNGAFGLAGLDGGFLDSSAIMDHWRDRAGMPDEGVDSKVDKALSDSITSGDFYLLIEVDPANGNITLWVAAADGTMIAIDPATIDGLEISYVNGELTYTLPIQTPENAAADDSVEITVSGVTVEKDPGDGEYDYANNIAVTEDSVTVVVDVDVITGEVVLNTDLLQNLYEDGQPYQYTDKDGNKIVGQGEDANRDYQEGFDPQWGVQIFVPDADGNYLHDGSESEFISSITFTDIPDASEGTLYYDFGDGNGPVAVTEGMVIENPDLSLLTFMPGENWSGDLTFDYQVEVSSSTSGQTVTHDKETVDVHVDSVADLADADTHGLDQDTNDAGQYVVNADDGEARLDDDGDKTGWYDSHASNETAVTGKLQLSFELYDLDGSETASILIPVGQGYVLLEDIDGGKPDVITIDGVDYYVYASGEAGELQQLLEDNGGTFELNVAVDKGAQGDDLKVYVRTEDDNTSPNNETGNDAAMREVGEGINMSWLDSAVKVSTGWAYEGGDGTKHMDGDNYDPNLGAIDNSSRTTVTIQGKEVQGAPVELTFADPETVTEVTFTYDPAQGTLYFDGVKIDGTLNPDGTVTVTIKPKAGGTIDDELNNMVFVPSSDYGDDDINLNYTVTINDGANEFLVEGSTKVVVDAVADRAVVEETSSAAGDDNASVVITVKSEFPDNDGSEQHYILVEVKDGWDCPDASGTTTVYYDAQGNVMHPSWNPDTQEWEAPAGYDEAAGHSSKEFWTIDVSDVTNTDNPQTEFEVTLTPTGPVEDTNFETGTMAVEKPGDEEYDYNNNVAYDFIEGGTDVNVMDAIISGSATGAYEDNDANQHGAKPGDANYVDDKGSGIITITIGKEGDNGFENSGEYLDTSADNYVTLTFDWDGDRDNTGSFSIVGGDGTEYPVVWDNELGQYKVEIPTEDFGSGDLDKFQLQYHPPLNDDTDLTNINITVPVTNDEGFTDTLDGKINDMIVDAVADKPIDVETSVKIDASEDNAAGYGKADWGSEVEITVGAKFNDYLDDSETHYLLIEARDGWTCDNADGVIEIDGTLYFYKEVSNEDLKANDGEASYSFNMTAPDADSGVKDVDTIAKDGTVNFETGGLAIEGGIKPSDDNPDVMVPDTKGSDGSEITHDNNVAFTPDDKGANIDFNTIDGSSGSGSAYEDHQKDQNKGVTTETQTSGWITIALADAGNETINSGTLTFRYDGDGEPGTFTYVDADNNVVEVPWTYDSETGLYSVELPTEICGDGQVQIRYNPPANDSTDLTDFGYELNVSANDSKAEGTVTGTVSSKDNKGKEHEGTFIVDAVADIPVDPNAGDVVYNGDDDLSAAAPGGTVDIPVSVKFGDYLDGSESHYIIVEQKSGWTPEPADSYTTITHGGKKYYALDVTKLIDSVVDDLNIDDFLAANPNGGTHTVTDNGVTITVTVNADGSLGDTVEVSTDVTLNVPGDQYNKTTDVEFQVGGYAVEEGYDDLELDLNNNTAINTDTAKVTVDPVESHPTITMDNNHIYENLTPNAHLTPDENGNIDKTDPKYVDAEDNQPATMKFEGLDSGETATVTLYFSASNEDGSPVDFSGGKVMVRDANGNYLEDENGNPIEFSLEGPDAGGNFYTVPALTLEGDSTIEFYPGTNYSDRDISVNYDITVRDDDSGAEHTWTTQPKPTDGTGDPNTTYDQNQGGIQVDAVAQAPDVALDPNNGDYPYFTTGTESITLNSNLTFHDYEDGSEFQYILVEAKTDYTITTITITGPDGQTWTLTLEANGENWMYDGTAYVRFEIPQEILDACGGELEVSINMDVPGGGSGKDSFKIGGMTQEDPNGLDGEATRDNNQAIRVDEVEIEYKGNGQITVSTEKDAVYEGDIKDAHVGGLDIEGGTEVYIRLPDTSTPQGSDVPNNEVTDINISCDNGTIYRFPNDMSDAQIKALLEEGGAALDAYKVDPDAEYSSDYVEGGRFVYIAEDTNDADANITVTGNVKNNQNGDEYNSGGETTVIVDAVAQQGEADGDKNDDGSYTIIATFPDMDDSEDHFVLIEARPGASLVVDGQTGPYEMYYHVDPDTGQMTAYWKVPVSESDLNEDGSYELNFTYNGAGEFGYGTMGEEVRLSGDGEVTLHNNVAVSEDGTLGENGSGGGGHTLPDDKYIPPGDGHKCPHPESDVSNTGAYENGTPNANIGDNSVGSGDAILNFRYWNWTHHTDKPAPEGEEPGGSWCSPDYQTPTEVSVTFNPGNCALLINDQYIVITGSDGEVDGVSWTVTGPDADGNYTVTISNYDESLTVALRPGDYSSAYENGAVDLDNLDQYFNNDDADFTYEWSMTGPGSQYPHPDHGYNPDGTYSDSGTGTVIVDAVAQGVDKDSLDYDDGGYVYGADQGNETTTIKVNAEFVDDDGSEAYYIIIEAVPGISVAGAETIYIDGTMYYKVQVDPDEANPDGTYNIDISINRSELENSFLEGRENKDANGDPDGTTTYELKWGAMTEEQLKEMENGDGELTYNNNMSYDLAENGMEITVSFVDSDVRVSTTDTYENDASTGAISVHIDLDANDNLDEFSITYDPEAGEIIYLDANGNQYSADGDPGSNFDDLFGSGNWSLAPDGNGNMVLTITNPDPDVLESGLTFSTDGNYSSTDTSITWEAKVSDGASGDTATFNGKQDIIIDAVAQGPDVTNVHLSNADGGSAALSGGEAQINLTLTFEDVGTGEMHYAVMANDGTWTCDSITIILPDGSEMNVTPTLMYDQQGNPFYAVEIQDSWLNSDGSVDVKFNVTAPEAGKDTSYDIRVGGISVEDFNQPDGELTLSNNWSENIQTVKIDVAVVETTEVNFTFGTIVENDPAGAAIALTQASKNALAANNEILTETTLTFDVNLSGGDFSEGNVIGTVIYDGMIYEVFLQGGKGVVNIDFGPNGYDENAEFRVVWGQVALDSNGDIIRDSETGNPVVNEWNHTGSNMTISADSTVQDTKSGETGQASGGGNAGWTATADAPTDINVTNPDDTYGNGVNVTFTVSAEFVDVDGSEQHYILVEAKDGWSLVSPKSAGIYEDADGNKYFMIAVDSKDPNPSVDITVKTPNDLANDETIKLEVGGMAKDGNSVETTFEGDSVAIDIGVVQATGVNLSMDTMLEDGTPTAMNFTLEGGQGDSITSITITNLGGGSIIGPDGLPISNFTFTGDKLADLLAGKYSYKPADNQSGEVTIKYNATVQDDASGAKKTFNDDGSVTITPVTDIPIEQTGSAKDPSQQAGHTASVTVNLAANFVDYTGSEVHFFLVQLPEGATPPSGWVEVTDSAILNASGMSSPVYMVTANGSGNASFTITVPENYDGGDLTYKAGSYEKDLPDSDPDKYQFSAEDKVAISETGELNYDPTANDSSSSVKDALRDPDAGASGKVTMKDADGDDVTVTKVEYTDADGNVTTGTQVVENGVTYLQVAGEYGTLLINVATGEYTYTLYDGVIPPHGYQENFSITVADDRGATDGANINISINASNADPTAVDPGLNAGGVNEGDLAILTGTVDLRDSDGDVVTITGITGGESAAVWDDATQTWTVQGKYGTLTIDVNGNYTYELDDHNSQGQESFKFTFQDPYGGTGEQNFTVNVDYVNHAPVIDDQQAYFDANSGSYINGKITFSDPDTDSQKDSVAITYVIYQGVTYEIGATYTDIVTEWGTMSIRADGSYVFNPADGASTADAWENFTIGVTDSNGLTTEGTFSLGLGDADPADLSAAGASAGLGIDPASALLGVEGLVGDDAPTVLFGTDGDDMLYGGAGDNIVYGIGGNDYMDGGTGANQLYGGTGNDILVFSADNSLIDGGDGIDFLIGASRDSLDEILGGETVKNIEVLVLDAPDSLSLTSMADFEALGVTVNGDSLSLSNDWARVEDSSISEQYAEYVYTGSNGYDDMTLLVQINVLENTQG